MLEYEEVSDNLDSILSTLQEEDLHKLSELIKDDKCYETLLLLEDNVDLMSDKIKQVLNNNVVEPNYRYE